jgi:hypothetical protein
VLVAFDLSTIPPGSLITSAVLELRMASAPSVTRTYNAHRVTRAWTESQVTWAQAASGSSWTTAGGDYAASPTASVASGTSSNVWLSWDVTADVNAWYTGGASNHGLLLKDNVEESSTTYSATFASSENGTAANRPRLVVTYTPPDLQITGLTVDASVVDGDLVTVTMTVKNNGPVALTGVTPSALSPSGSAGAALDSGPIPASVASLDPGASTVFTWDYTITGNNGQTYAFTGSVSASGGGVTGGPATTNTGTISTYGLTVLPTSVYANATSVQVTFQVTNGLSSGTVDRVTITDPSTSIWQFNDPGWGANDGTGWTQSLNNGNRFRFTSPAAGQDIGANGASKTFTVTFSTIGNPGSDTNYTFSVAVRQRGRRESSSSI